MYGESYPPQTCPFGSLITATEVRKAAGTLKRTLPLAALQVGTLRERDVPGTFQIMELHETRPSSFPKVLKAMFDAVDLGLGSSAISVWSLSSDQH